ncbi:MAG: heme NO-binding domain-containing protein [Planctomycetaceae bacterium]
MKGIAFTLFSELVESVFGLATWDKVLRTTGDDGVFTTAGNYADERMMKLVGSLSEHTGLASNALIRTFGEFMFGGFVRTYPSFFEREQTAKQLLKSVDSIIHVEVKKLFPNAILPRFDYEDPSENELVMIYRSERKMCVLAEGLFNGAAKHFRTPVEYKQTKCLLTGDDHCRFELTFPQTDISTAKVEARR